MPASPSAWHTAPMSVGPQRNSNASPLSMMSSAPASTAVSIRSSSVTVFAPCFFGTATTPRRANCHATAPGSAMLPPFFENAVRTSEPERLRLSVDTCTSRATPAGAYPSYMMSSIVRSALSSPVPRLMALSILSAGTCSAFAFVIIVRSVALPSLSPPPSRAATSMFRTSFAQSLPRALSAAPFLCLIVAHLE